MKASIPKPLPLKEMSRFTVLSLLTMGEAYLKERGFEKSRQEAEELLFTLLSLTRIDLYLDPNRPVSNEDQEIFSHRIARRGKHEPLQYITGQVIFCGLPFSVSPGVFIPRPETELIVEEVRYLLPTPQVILDICTGSGALAISLAKQFPSASITAIDCSDIALEAARLNQKNHQANQVNFLKGDLFSALTPQYHDLIVCNPPYIAEGDRHTMDVEVLEHEPSLALFSPDNGLAHIKRVLIEAPAFLAPLGTLILEIGKGQSVPLIEFIKNKTPFHLKIIQDFSGIDRILVCQIR